MVRTHALVLRKHLRQLADDRSADADALTRHRAGDPDAFAELVQRHGPMVYGVCRRILGPSPDADDAFQAVFLALIRNSSAVRNASALPAWLHRVALRTVRKALARRKPVRPSDDLIASKHPGPADQAAWADVRRALDEELNRLPESFRSALVLCYLDGATRDEAARRLGWTVATLDRRLATGRARLRDRLVRRGLGAVALGTAVFADGLRAIVPARLISTTSALAEAGESASAAVRTLAAGRAVVPIPVATVVLVMGTLTVTLIGAGRPASDEPTRPPAGKAAAAEPGEPLPDGAVVRLGSPKFRHAGLGDFAWSADSTSVTTIGSDRVIRTWDVAIGRQTKAVPLKKLTGRMFTISADGKLAAACGNDTATIFDSATGESLAVLRNLKAGPSQLGFSPDGRRLYIGGQNSGMTVWDWKADTTREAPVRAEHSGQDSTFHGYFSKDGRYFVAGLWAFQPLRVFDLATWGEEFSLKCFAATSTVSPDGKRLIVSSSVNDAGNREAVIRVFDLATRKEVQKFPLGHDNVYYSLALAPDGKLLACGASDRSCLFDLTTGKVLHTLTGRPWGLGFSPDSQTFAATAEGNHVRFWDVATGKERHEQPGGFGPETVTGVSPDGRLLAAAGWMDQAVRVWDTTTGRPVAQFPLKDGARYARDLTFSPDGKTLAAGLYYGSAQTWDIATGKSLWTFQLVDPVRRVDREYCFAARLSPDGRRLVTVRDAHDRAEGTRLTVWDVTTGKPLRERTIGGWSGGKRAWSPDGETLAIARDTGVVLTDLDTGEDRAVLAESAPKAATVSMSRDGRLVAASRAKDIGVYEVATGRLMATAAVGPGRLTVAADNRTLFTADESHLRAWDLATGREVGARPLGSAEVSALVPLAGRRVLTPMADGTGLVWDFAPAPPSGTKADARQLDAWWNDLRADDPATAYAAVWKLTEAISDAAVPFLARHLRPEPAPDPAKLRQLIADLDSDRFAARERAVKGLEALGHAAAPALRAALAAGPTAEAGRRIEQFLARKPDVAAHPDKLRRLRAMQVLERIATPEARQVLIDLADGLPLAAETREARAAVARTSP